MTGNNNSPKSHLLTALLIASIAGLISQFLSYHFDYNFAYRDSIFRMEAARRFFDSNTPGIINQLGTVWLPIPNLVLMPLDYRDFLWETGLAASIVNLPLFVISAVAIFLCIRKLTKNIIAGWFGFLVFTFNYNILYFQTTAMTEQFYLTFIICGFYFLLTWSQNNIIKHLVYSSLFISLSVGTRYDAWPVALVSTAIVYYISKKNKVKPIEHAMVFGLLPVFLMIAWFIYNWIYYGDPLEFSRGQFSTAHQLKYYEDKGRLLTKNNLLLSGKVYFDSVFLYSGKLFVLLALAGLIIYIYQNKLKAQSLPAYMLLLALPTTLLLLYK